MKNLCQAIISSSCFLELSPDEIVEPDAAVKAFEDIATALQAATEAEKEAFRHECADEASRLENAGPSWARTAEFIRNLPEAIGIWWLRTPCRVPLRITHSASFCQKL